MPYYILTGAGFSKNWGGWLSTELWGYLLGHPEIQNNNELKSLLWKNRQQGFENALEEARQKSLTKDEWKNPHKNLEKAVIEAFGQMDNLFKGTYNEFGQTHYIMENFIAKFDAFFTTNQDLLIERKFPNLINSITFSVKKNISSFGKPGIKPNQVTNHILDSVPTWCPNENLTLDKNVMPYIKLHGCMNGRSSSGHLMIMGGQKEDQIAKEPLINWYFEILKNKLSNLGSKLLIIGYSFLDSHINKIIFDAVDTANLKLYVWNTSGLDKIFNNLTSINQASYRDLFEKGLISINTKPLKELFLQDGLLTHELNIAEKAIFQEWRDM